MQDGEGWWPWCVQGCVKHGTFGELEAWTIKCDVVWDDGHGHKKKICGHEVYKTKSSYFKSFRSLNTSLEQLIFVYMEQVVWHHKR